MSGCPYRSRTSLRYSRPVPAGEPALATDLLAER
ncbi:hypothetical protein EDD98_5921 [Streptomyces sp. PanSC19]|nr:hypothetical protein EDD98_5921 [Streptomyces sp. PanSC19]